MFNVAKSKDDEPILVNLSKSFREKKVYTFPQHFTGLEHKRQMIFSLKAAAITSGFVLVKKDDTSVARLIERNSKFDVETRFCCQSAVPYQERKRDNDETTTRTRRTVTIRPICNEDCCKFRFMLKMTSKRHHLGAGRWIVQRSKRKLFL